MRITRLELVDYKRLLSSNIRHFIIQPTEPQQLILGTNGSGKSSILDELTPLPALKDAYGKEGSKTIEIAHLGSKYILSSTFKPKAHHSFLKDGEELNPGGTITVQKELVFREFGIDDQIHDLTQGRIEFTKMSPNDRRIWLTKMSEVSYDYAISVYGKLVSRHRDAVGMLRNAKSQLVEETGKLVSDAEEAKLREDVSQLHSELTLLLENRDTKVDLYGGEDKLYRLEQGLHVLAKQLIRLQVRRPFGSDCKSVEDITACIEEIKLDIAARQSVLDHQVEEHGKLEKGVEALIKAGDEGVAALRKKIIPLREQRERALKGQVLGLAGIDPVEGAKALETAYGLLHDTLVAMPINEDRRFGQASLRTARERLATLKTEQGTVLTAISRLEAKQGHLESHRSDTTTQCPKCRHTWIQGFSEEQLEKLVEQISRGESRRKELESQIADVEAEIQAILDYAEQYRDFTNAVASFVVLRPFWDHILEDDLIFTAPRVVNTKMEQLRWDLGRGLEANECETRIAEIEKIILSATEAGDADVEEASLRLHLLSEQISTLTAEIATRYDRLREFTDYKAQVTEALSMAKAVEESMQLMQQGITDQAEVLRQQTLDRVIRSHQSLLSRKEEALREIDRQKTVVEVLTQSIARSELDEQAYGRLAKELSPKEGLIAEGLMGFIRNFTGQMNGLIRKVWTHPLSVLPCGSADAGGAELDYKFPMMVNHKSNIVPDVGRGSAGQREMVDFSFMVVARRYLGLSDAPLFLDEFGTALDEVHRTQAMNLIKSLMDQQAFPQLFMISHYASTHGTMTQAQICVVDPSNITVPNRYNQHVLIE